MTDPIELLRMHFRSLLTWEIVHVHRFIYKSEGSCSSHAKWHSVSTAIQNYRWFTGVVNSALSAHRRNIQDVSQDHSWLE